MRIDQLTVLNFKRFEENTFLLHPRFTRTRPPYQTGLHTAGDPARGRCMAGIWAGLES